jgi:hypothetical protein
VSTSSKQAIVGLGAIAAVLVLITIISSRGAADRELRADVLSTRRAVPGETVDITISTRDRFGIVTRVEVDFGDGTPKAVDEQAVTAADCRSEFARADNFDFRHTYEGFEGPVTVRAVVVSGGCGAPEERVTAIRTINVKPLRR